MARLVGKQKLVASLPKELVERIQIIGKIEDEELGFAVRNNLLKWWEVKAWQELKKR